MKAEEVLNQCNPAVVPEHLIDDHIEFHTGWRGEDEDAIKLYNKCISIYSVSTNWDMTEKEVLENLKLYNINIICIEEDQMIALLDYYFAASKLGKFPLD